MKLWELIVELEKLEQLGKRDYEVKIMVWSDEVDLDKNGIWAEDNKKIIWL